MKEEYLKSLIDEFEAYNLKDYKTWYTWYIPEYFMLDVKESNLCTDKPVSEQNLSLIFYPLRVLQRTKYHATLKKDTTLIALIDQISNYIFYLLSQVTLEY